MVKRRFKYIIGTILLAQVYLWASIDVEFSTDRIEAGKKFRMSLVMPIDELPSPRGVPEITDLQGFKLSKVDSTDERVRQFFMGVVRVRKYHYHLTAPSNPGRYGLPMQWEMNGQRRSIGKISVDVARPYEAAALRVILSPSKSTLYEGEQLRLAMTLQTFENFQGGLNLSSIDLGSDFTAHRAELSNIQFQRSATPGVNSEASGNIAWIAPIRSGSLEVPELVFNYQKMGERKVVQKQMGNMSFSSVTQGTEEATARSRRIKLNVLPLPAENRPANFSGMVGQYSFDAKIDKTELEVGEALTLSISIRGNGKPGSIPDPILPNFNDFRSVPPETRVSKRVQNNQVWTTKTIKLFLYPKKRGEFELPTVSFNWFDPQKKQYVVQNTPAWEIKVEKGELTEAAATGGGVLATGVVGTEKKSIETLGKDIRHIKEKAEIRTHSEPIYQNLKWWLALVAPFVFLMLFRWWYARYIGLRSNRAYMRREGARKKMQKSLAELRTSIEKEQVQDFYTGLEAALLNYLGDIFNRELTGLTRTDLSDILAKDGLEEADVQQILSWLEQGDQARFAPLSSSAADLSALVDKMQELCLKVGNL